MEACRLRDEFVVETRRSSPPTHDVRATFAEAAAEWLRNQQDRVRVGDLRSSGHPPAPDGRITVADALYADPDTSYTWTGASTTALRGTHLCRPAPMQSARAHVRRCGAAFRRRRDSAARRAWGWR